MAARRPAASPGAQATDQLHRVDDATLAAGAVEAGFAQSTVGQSVVTLDGRILRANAAMCALLGRPADEVVGSTWEAVSHPDDVGMCHQELQLLAEAPTRERTAVKRYLRPDGVIVRALITSTLVEVEGRSCYVSRVRDIPSLRDEQDALEVERAVAADLQEGQAAVLEGVVRGQPLEVTLGAVARLAELALHGAVAAVHLMDDARRGLDFVAGPGMPLEMVRAGQRLAIGPEGGLCGSAAAAGQLVVADVPADPRSAPFRALAARMGVRSAWCQPLRNREGAVLGVLSCYVSKRGGPDAAERRRLELVARLATVAVERDHADRALRRQAREDPLTGLANRMLLLEHTERALAGIAAGRQIALLFCDVDRLKPVNDTLGHASGDELLVAVGRRLRSAAPHGATVARLSGDEFVVLLDDVTGVDEAASVGTALVRAASAPLRVDSTELRVSISVGVAVASSAAPVLPCALDLLRDADMAMYRAKARGRARVEVFDRDLHTLSARTWHLERDLRAAVTDGALEVHYQPQLRLSDGTLHGVEALVRWTLPTGERVPPSEFIPVAEDAGLIVDLGAHVLRVACRDVVSLGSGTVVSVNISARQLLDPGLPRVVAGALEEAGLPGERLCLEITESVLMEDAPGLLDRLNRLRDLGVAISIDDLGTGYSSLLYLKRLPVTQLKVDTSFVGGVGEDPEDDAIVAAIVGLGSALAIDVVAEGVETDIQLRRLRDLGCPLAQGYLLGRPVPVEQLQRR